MDRSYFVYILSNKRNNVIYTGVTNDLVRRVSEHKLHKVPGFTAMYNVNKLVFYEQTESVESAIAREKQLKGWRRSKKIALIEAENPSWHDLSNHFDTENVAESPPVQNGTSWPCYKRAARLRTR